MEKKIKDLDILTAKIKRLIKLRGKTFKDLASQMGVSYFSVSHFFCRKPYITKKGTHCGYDLPHVRRAITDFLQVPYEDLYYGEGVKLIDSLIEIEIAAAVRKLVEENLTLYKPKK